MAVSNDMSKIADLLAKTSKNSKGTIEIHIRKPEIAEYSKVDGKIKKLTDSKTEMAEGLRAMGEFTLTKYNEINKDDVKTVLFVDETDQAAVSCTVKDQYSIDPKMIQVAESTLTEELFLSAFQKTISRRLKTDSEGYLLQMLEQKFGRESIAEFIEEVVSYSPTPLFEHVAAKANPDAQRLLRNSARRHAPTLRAIAVEKE